MVITMNVEEYIKNRHQNKSMDSDKKVKYLKFLVTRILLSIILVISVCIYLKMDDKNILLVEKYFFENSIEFTKINNWYQNNVGKIIPSINTNSDLVFSSSDILSNKYVEYYDGVKINVSKNSPVSLIMGGIVVFIGEKDNYGNTLIIQGNDGIDYWYGGITNIAVNLYDYLEKDTLIGECKDNYLYLVLQKNGEFIKYEEIL